MINLFLTVVPALQLKNGKHTVRIGVTHSGQTRYIPTDVLLNSEKEIKDGRITNRSDKVNLNLHLQKLIGVYEERANSISYPDALTCSQLVRIIKKECTAQKHRTFADVSDEYISQIEEDRAKSRKLYSLAARRYMSYAGEDCFIEHITPLHINNYLMWLQKQKLSPTTINIYTTLLKVILNYAQKMKYVEFEIDPFVTARVPNSKKRDTFITPEQFKKIRDAEIGRHNLSVIRDIFVLTYYLAGMNLVDMLEYDFRNTDEIYYVRKKTRNTKEGENAINFTIPDEAWPIIDKYMNKKTGKLVFGRYSSYVSCYNVLARKIKDLAAIGGIRHYFTLYSARKSFVQHGFDLGIPLSTLEYCIGQTMKESRPIFNYVSIMKRHADKAIREILDNLK